MLAVSQENADMVFRRLQNDGDTWADIVECTLPCDMFEQFLSDKEILLKY